MFTQSLKNHLSQKNENLFVSVFVFLFLVAVDQVSKFYASNIFNNFYFAFSLPVPKVLMYLIYALVLFFALKYFLKNYSNFSRLSFYSWTLIFAGAVSNLGERIYLGYVRDFIYIWNGVLNFADFYIILGVLLLLVFSRSKAMY